MNEKVKSALDQFDTHIERLSETLDEISASEEFKRYLQFMGAFHNYSIHNAMLIMSQYPEARMVAGFRKWKEFGRHVKKGSKGIMILCPRKKKIKKDETDRQLDMIYSDSEQSKKEEITVTYFYPGYVFDVAQTDGEPLPENPYKCEWLIGDDNKGFYAALWYLAQSWDIEITEAMMPESQGGASKVFEPKIAINDGHCYNQKTFSLIHEIAHQLLHRDPDRPETVTVRELEAEAVAFVVASHFEMDVIYHAASYIAAYRGDKDGLKKSLSRIRTAGKKIIDGLYGSTITDDEKAVA